MDLPFSWDWVDAGQDIMVCDVPGGVDNVDALLKVLATELKFPSYFGYNWPALDECLSDLDWIKTSVVVIKHTDIPLHGDVIEAGTYLRVLARGVRVREPEGPALVVSFPNSLRVEEERIFMNRLEHRKEGS